MFREKIMSKIPIEGTWGSVLNDLQDVAYDVLTREEILAYLEKEEADEEKAGGNDGVLFNGDYYDWREFNTKRNNIISSWLSYFPEESLEKIYKGLEHAN